MAVLHECPLAPALRLYAPTVLARKSWRLEEVVIPVAAIGLLTAAGLASLFTLKTEAPPAGVGLLWASAIIFQLPLLLLVHRFLHRHGESWSHGFGFDHPTRPPLGIWVVASVAGCVTSLLAVNWGMQRLLEYLGAAEDGRLQGHFSELAAKTANNYTIRAVPPITEYGDFLTRLDAVQRASSAVFV